MAWLAIDDLFPDHPKMAALGDLRPVAGWLHLTALCYASRYLTNGFIPLAQLLTLTNFQHLGYLTAGVPGQVEVGEDVNVEVLVDALVRVGLWHERDGGYMIHDYLKYNPSKKKVTQLREMKRKAGQAGGQASAQARAQAPATHSGSTFPNSPSPSPSPPNTTTKKDSHGPLGPSPPIPDTMTPEEFVEGWNGICTVDGLPRVEALTPARRKKILLRLAEHPTSAWWGDVMNKLCESDFLLGRSGNGTWKATLDWLIRNADNAVKIHEGNYDHAN